MLKVMQRISNNDVFIKVAAFRNQLTITKTSFKLHDVCTIFRDNEHRSSEYIAEILEL